MLVIYVATLQLDRQQTKPFSLFGYRLIDIYIYIFFEKGLIDLLIC